MPGPTGPDMKVWDAPLRILHWSLAAGIVAGWFTRHARGDVHDWVGYAAWAVVMARIAWGWAGTEYSRFSQFVRGPVHTLGYARRVVSTGAPRYVGHNPLGGWMTVALLAAVFIVCLSGWMSTTERWWGIEWVGNLHLWSTYLVLVMVGVHLVGVLHSSITHRENLVAAMLHGRKSPPRAADVD